MRLKLYNMIFICKFSSSLLSQANYVISKNNGTIFAFLNGFFLLVKVYLIKKFLALLKVDLLSHFQSNIFQILSLFLYEIRNNYEGSISS